MNPGVQRLHFRFYDSVAAWANGTERFGSYVRKRLQPRMSVLNLGAGPGTGWLHFDREVTNVVGVDPDAAIRCNRRLTHRVRGVAEALPFHEGSFDLVYMDWVVEHLPSPKHVAVDIYRVLKPNGYLLFRTGNLFHYSYAIASVTPHWFHKVVLREHIENEPYPTYYRMNTVSAMRRVLGDAGFIEEELEMMEPEPAYVCMSQATFLAGVFYERLVNRFDILRSIRANILGCFRKPACDRARFTPAGINDKIRIAHSRRVRSYPGTCAESSR